MGVWSIGRRLAYASRWYILCFGPGKVSIISVVVDHPPVSKKLNRRKLLEKCRG